MDVRRRREVFLFRPHDGQLQSEIRSLRPGSKGAFTISASGHSPAKSTIYKSQRIEKDNILWTASQPEKNPYRLEWEHLVAAILADTPFNEAKRAPRPASSRRWGGLRPTPADSSPTRKC